MRNRITINNELPDLLAAVCSHPDCEDWLRHAIWDAFNNRDQVCVYSADYWRAVMDSLTQAREERAMSNDTASIEAANPAQIH